MSDVSCTLLHQHVGKHILHVQLDSCACRSVQRLQRVPGDADAGAQVYNASPAWTLKGKASPDQRLHVSAEMDRQQLPADLPGPEYDVDAAYKYLEQVCRCHTDSMCLPHVFVSTDWQQPPFELPAKDIA